MLKLLGICLEDAEVAAPAIAGCWLKMRLRETLEEVLFLLKTRRKTGEMRVFCESALLYPVFSHELVLFWASEIYRNETLISLTQRENYWLSMDKSTYRAPLRVLGDISAKPEEEFLRPRQSLHHSLQRSPRCEVS